MKFKTSRFRSGTLLLAGMLMLPGLVFTGCAYSKAEDIATAAEASLPEAALEQLESVRDSSPDKDKDTRDFSGIETLFPDFHQTVSFSSIDENIHIGISLKKWNAENKYWDTLTVSSLTSSPVDPNCSMYLTLGEYQNGDAGVIFNAITKSGKVQLQIDNTFTGVFDSASPVTCVFTSQTEIPENNLVPVLLAGQNTGQSTLESIWENGKPDPDNFQIPDDVENLCVLMIQIEKAGSEDVAGRRTYD